MLCVHRPTAQMIFSFLMEKKKDIAQLFEFELVHTKHKSGTLPQH